MTSGSGIYRRIGELIRAAREKAGLTQEELGQRIGLTRTSITNIENGRQNIQVHTLYSIASVLDTSPHAFLPLLEVPSSNELQEQLRSAAVDPQERQWIEGVLNQKGG